MSQATPLPPGSLVDYVPEPDDETPAPVEPTPAPQSRIIPFRERRRRGRKAATNEAIAGQRSPPHDPAAERGVLAAMAWSPTARRLALLQLQDRHFYLPQHQHIFAALSQLAKEDRQIDALVIKDRLKTSGLMEDLEGAGGEAYVDEVLTTETSGLHIGEYVEILLNQTIARRLHHAAQEILADVHAGGASAPAILTAAKLQLEDMEVDRLRDEPRVSLGDLVRKHQHMNDPIIHGMLRVGETMNLIAPSKTGKSWLTLSLAACVAGGKDWLGQQTSAGEVLLIDNELHEKTLAQRARDVIAAYDLDPKVIDNIQIQSLRGRLQDIVAIGKTFSRFKPGDLKLIIIDAWYRAVPKNTDENDNGAVAHLYNLIDSYAMALGCAFVLVHHTSKGQQGQKSVVDVGAGAGAQARAADCHLVLRRHKEATRENPICIADAAVRSWAPLAPFALRFQDRRWERAPDFDPGDHEGTEAPPKKEIDPQEFATKYAPPDGRPVLGSTIISLAELHGMSTAEANRKLSQAVAAGMLYKGKLPKSSAWNYSLKPFPAPPDQPEARKVLDSPEDVPPPAPESTPWTPSAEKRRAIMEYMEANKNAEIPEIARDCGVSKAYVFKIRSMMVAAATNPPAAALSIPSPDDPSEAAPPS